MRSITLADATDLAFWANRRHAQATLPQLLRRLVHATAEQIQHAEFRAGEGVQLAGWDGIVVIEQGNEFVPDGVSAWELGTGKNIRGKADEDFAKRSKDPRGVDPAQSTFVFVTPRRWARKDEWVEARKGEDVWRDVRAYDADNLEQWLELAPAVHIWVSILLGKHPDDVMDLGTYWDDWSETTRPATPPGLVLSGRKNVVESVHGWLREPSGPLALQAESRDEALAVFAGALQQLPKDEATSHLSRAVVVRSLGAWQRLIASDKVLILVLDFDDRDAVTRAVRAGHQVVIPRGRADSASASTLKIGRLSREDAEKALIAGGMGEDRARELATLARRSLSSFRRKLALSPDVRQPQWAQPSEGRYLLPALLAGAWSDGKDGDREALAALAQLSYEDFSGTLVRWANETDPPVRRVGAAWFVVSKEDAWSLLARYLTQDDLKRFGKVVLEVLGAPDPRLDLPDEQQPIAGLLGHVPRHSGLLYRGLADALALMGAHRDLPQPPSGVSPHVYVEQAIRQLLSRANADWCLWASLSPVLPLLAEAAPDAFLDAIDAGLVGDEPVLARLFTDQELGFFNSSPHTGLLWALETVAWSSEHLGRAALALAKLSRLDPGGKLANRPHDSLRKVFCLWHPQTAAALFERLGVLDMLRKGEPDVAWGLLCQLLPKRWDVVHNTSTPRWREWVPDSSTRVTQGEHVKGVHEVTSRLLTAAGESGNRWRDLIVALPELPVEYQEAMIERVAEVDLARLHSSDRVTICDALRELISRHRSFPDTAWSLPKDRVDRLHKAYQRLEPDDPADRYGWLFGGTPALLDGRAGDYQAQQQAIVSARVDVVRLVYIQGGLAALLGLAGSVEKPGELGLALGRSELAVAEEDDLLTQHLAEGDAARAHFARGFAAGRVWKQGREWAEGKLSDVAVAWSPSQQAQLLACLPADGRTWDLAEAAGPEPERQYWQLVPLLWIEEADVERAARKLLEHGRPYTAVDLLASHAERKEALPAKLVADALEGAAKTSPKEDPPAGSFVYQVCQLLDLLAGSSDVDENRLAALEWAFLSLIARHERPPKLLHRELARDPDFFAQVVKLVYGAAGEEPRELTDEEQARDECGRELLQSWRTVPGRDEAGAIDADALADWVRRAREGTLASGRGASADYIIGEVLSGSPEGDDGAWPHPAVRDVIEEVASADLEQGLQIGLYNSRGIVMKDPSGGGAEERQLAERYARFAAAIGNRWPRTAAMLRRIEATYQKEARNEDEAAELREDLGY